MSGSPLGIAKMAGSTGNHKMKAFLFLLFLPLSAFAGDIYGSLMAYKLVDSNLPGYLDLTGPEQRYGLQADLYIPIYSGLVGYTGVTGVAGDQYFTQIAGRFGMGYTLPTGLEFGVWHQSTHSLDHYNRMQYRFWNENRLYVKYNFGKEPK